MSSVAIVVAPVNRYPPSDPIGTPRQPRPRALCQHCGQRFANRSRGLCWHCYYEPGVRDQYATAPGYYPSVNGMSHGHEPEEATMAPPGSMEKIRIMIERAAAGQSLHHPKDLRFKARGDTGHIRVASLRGFLEPESLFRNPIFLD